MQQASAGGSGNTIVQIVGDGNSVVTGQPHLTLTRYVARRQVRQDLDRLSPYTRSTTLVGREAELASLQSYLSSPRAMAARVLVGGGGSGKTRLALELCEDAAASGWDAGFVTRTELRRFFDQQNLSIWGWRNPTLIVVDYAAEHAQLLSHWIGELVDRAQPRPQPMRMLLLERSASTETGWWTTVFASGGWGASGKRALLDPPEPVPIRPLAHADDRLALLRQMLTRSGADQGISLQLEERALRDKLMQLSWGGDPLFLMMAALEMVRVGHAKALTLGRTDLAQALATREAERLQQLAGTRSLSPELVLHLAACVTLAQGMARDDFERFATGEKLAIGRPSGGDVAALADLLQQALPRTNGIAPVLPDLIGDALIVLTLRQEAGTAAVVRCHVSFGQAAVETVIRCTQDFAEQSKAPLGWLNAIVDAIGDDDDALTALGASLPMDSVALRDVNLQVAQRLHRLRAAREDAPLEARASALNGLATALAKVGQPEPALQAAQEAVDIRRELAALRPDEFRANLAGSLNTLANRLGALGQSELALKAALEASSLFRELAALRPDVFRTHLAGSLTNLANVLRALRQSEPALQAAQEAAGLYRKLDALQPDVFRPDLAGSLNNLAGMLSALAQREPALEAAQEAADLYRELAASRPDEFRPSLAPALNTLAITLGALDQREAALQIAQEVADLYRKLAALWPDVFQPELAASLNNLANRLSALGQPEPALKAAQEATGLFRILAAVRPAVFRLGLAGSLSTLASRLSALGQLEPALKAAQAASSLYRDLAALQPDVFRPDLAMSLTILAHVLGALGQSEPALRAAQEAVDMRRELATRRPDVFRPDLAASLNNLTNALSALGQSEAALEAAQEAVDIRRELATLRPDVFRSDLATSLFVLALRSRDSGAIGSAMQLAHEAVQTLTPEFLRRPHAHTGLLGAIVREYVQLCESAGSKPDSALLQPLMPHLI